MIDIINSSKDKKEQVKRLDSEVIGLLNELEIIQNEYADLNCPDKVLACYRIGKAIKSGFKNEIKERTGKQNESTI